MKALPMLQERTCNGACCAVFSWPIEYDSERATDGPFIADMLIRLTHEEAVERAARFGATAPDPERQAELGRAPHTCRHWDEDTRLCTVYDERPAMCRNYPYDVGCDHDCDYRVAPTVQACYRLGKIHRTLWTKKEQWAVIVGDPRADVNVKGHALHYGKGTTKCGLDLSHARVVRRTKRLVACRGCFPEVYAK